MVQELSNYSVFISFKYSDGNEATRDYQLGLELFDRLKNSKVEAYFSPVSLGTRLRGDYSQAIDDALDQCSVLVLVGTSTKNVQSDWVRYEWGSFLNDIRSGRKPKGQLFTLLEGIGPSDLPRPLRQQQSFHAIDLARLCESIAALLTDSGSAAVDPLALDEPDSERSSSIGSRFEGFRRSPTIDDCGDLVRAYSSRSRATQALRVDEVVAASRFVDMSGISLNFICQQFPGDQLLQMVQGRSTLRLLFLEPDGAAMAVREREEGYTPGRLSALTSLNITTMLGLRARLGADERSGLAIRTIDETALFNTTILDHEFCVVQPYLPGIRGVDSPTLAMVRRTNTGLFNTFAVTFERQWERASEYDC